MRVDLFDFDLPPERIALRPAQPREAARMLVVGAGRRARRSRIVPTCRDCLRPGDALVVNDTRVIAARLDGIRVRGDADAAHRGDADQAARRQPLAGAASGRPRS